MTAALADVLAKLPDRASPIRPLATVTLDTIKPEHVTWLWPGRVPFGKVTILEGDPGIGKGHLIAEIIAAITTGRALPDGVPQCAANVVLVSLEDGVADTLRPRIEAAGAALDRVRVVTDLPTLPADALALAEHVRSDRARLLVLDPITAYLGSDTDSYKDQDVRRALMPLAQLAEDTGCAIIVVRHLPKSRNRSAVLAGAGSIGFIGLARSALLIAPKPDAPDRRVLAVAKASLAEYAPSLEFGIVSTAGGSRLEWFGRSELSAGALHAAHADAASDDVSQTDEAANWLRDLLTAREMPRAEVLKAGRAEGFSDRVVRRAATKVGVRMTRRGFGAGTVWKLSAQPTTSPGLHSDRSDPIQPVPNGRSECTTDGPNGALDRAPREAALCTEQ